MPQVGDSIKLYVPESDENESFIRLINRKDGISSSKTQDVNIKYLGNTYGKEIKLAPEEFKISTSSSGDITFNSNKTSIKAKESIKTTVNFCSETLDGISHFKGDNITINGTTKS